MYGRDYKADKEKTSKFFPVIAQLYEKIENIFRLDVAAHKGKLC